MSEELEKLKKLKKIEKFNLVWQIVFVIVFILLLILNSVFIANSVVNNNNNIYENSPNTSTTDTPLISSTIILAIIGLYSLITFIINLIFNIKSIVCSSRLVKSKNKSLYLIMSILAIFFLGVISNLVNFIVCKNEIKDIENNPSDTYGQTYVGEKPTAPSQSIY